MRALWTSFADVCLALSGFLILIVVIMVAYLNPGEEDEEELSQRAALSIAIKWDVGSDVDLWVKAPGTPAIGYANKHGPWLDIIRDDLGSFRNPICGYCEEAYARKVPDGEYRVNLHLYSNKEKPERGVRVWYEISLKKEEGSGRKILFSGEKVLRRRGDEETVVRFTLKDGILQEELTSRVPIRVRPQRAIP